MTDSEQASLLETRLRNAEAAKSGSYEKRTDHIDDNGHTLFINRLVLEDSPYLLQHAHNPVNWYPWGAEAFATAQAENKPVFLSIGYSTCHWCHVMEVESFDNIEVARVLNQHFISIKLDREQYPDIDEIYMTGVQLMSGQGGWPMSNFLLPDGRPFFGATYFPTPSLLQLLGQIISAWRDKYDELEKSAASIDQAIKRILGAIESEAGNAAGNETQGAARIDATIIDATAEALYQREDRDLGGLAGAPKFPQEPLLLFLLDRAASSHELSAYAFIERALDAMGRGGIYDQVGGGFHRYSVDDRWLVPHFEKMLYNQSQLGLVYLQAWELSGEPFFRRICEETLNYVLRDMQLPEGGFYSATDADSEGEEGTFFLWTLEQLEEVLDPAEVQQVIDVYGVTEAGNFENSNILNMARSSTELEREFGGRYIEKLDGIRSKLYQSREQRIHPLRDDKLIVGWCAAMITTLATAAAVLKNSEWLAAAEKAARLIHDHNLQNTGRLQRIYLNGTTSIDGQLEDYANYTQALLRLFDVTEKSHYLEWAAAVMDSMIEEFWDEEQGGFFVSPQQQHGPQLARSKNASDGATLSPVAAALECLQQLKQRAALLDEEHDVLFYREKAARCRQVLTGQINEHSLSHSSLLRLLDDNSSSSLQTIQYAGDGRLRVASESVATSSDGTVEVELRLSLADGWHITAPQEIEGSFVPLHLKLADQESNWQLEEVDYPAANCSLALQGQGAVAIYENSVQIKVRLRPNADAVDALSGSAGLELLIQLCDENNCLLPERLHFTLAVSPIVLQAHSE